ncbi:MAG: polysaccharide biosynthesis tyrosine autokinase [Pirellulaceae bacterium]|nr:polysaccharide biosynthesis tyrosine autokinase [Pirellulaceae bacterium]
MSQLMDVSPNRGLVTAGLPEMASPRQQQGIDLVRILWRWKWLPMLGALIGAGAGFMYFTKLPSRYLSFALVQVVSAMPTSVNSVVYDPEKIAYFTNRKDESRAIKSQAVLTLAVKVGKLEKHFPDMTPANIVSLLADEKRGVDVQPAEKAERLTTEQLFISYRSTDPSVSFAVVDAVVKGYQAFLAEEYKTVDTEVLKFFANTEKRLAKVYQDLYEQLQKFREEAPNVLWTGEDAVDPFAESYMRLKVQLEDARINLARLKSSLQQIVEAQKQNRRPEEILVMLQEGMNYVQSTYVRQLNEPHVTHVAESEKIERSFLIPLRAKEQQLLTSYGPAHPSVQTVRREIEVITEQIAAVRKIEDLDKAAKEKLLSKSDAYSAVTLPNAQRPTSLVSSDPPAETEERSESALQSLVSAQLVEMYANAFREQYKSLDRHQADLEAMANEELKKSQELQSFLSRNRLLKDQLASVKVMLGSFSEKVRAVELTPTNANQRILKELNPASIGMPDGPYPIVYIGGGAVFGLLLMCGLSILMDLADRSYRSPDEIVSDMGRPILGHIPAIELDKIKKVVQDVDASLITIHHGRGRVAEAFRSVRTSLFFSSRGSDLKVIQVTSPVPGDGKSTMSANLAVAMAQSGRRVVLVDADLRRPRQHKLFGIQGNVGLAQVLTDKADLSDATIPSCVANLSLIPGGEHPSNPSELLSSGRFAELIEVLREKYDIVILDTPPLLAVSDPSAVAAVSDGVILTMRLRRNIKPLATRALSILESVDAHVLGMVVNGVSTEAAYGSYGYSYSYNDYRDSYRYDSHRYGDGRYGEYSIGYIEEQQRVDEPTEASGAKNQS